MSDVPITKEDVQRLGRLAHLHISEQEATTLESNLKEMICFIDEIKKVDTKGVQPLHNVLEASPGVGVRLREDEVSEGGIASDLLKNAAESEEGFYVVPKTVGEDAH